METLHPGLYLQQVAGTPPMEGSSTSTGAFIGTAPKGKVGVPVLITSWTQYLKEFGGFDNDSYLAYAVKGFFENGGSRCYVVRTVHYLVAGDIITATSKPAVLDLKDNSATPLVVASLSAKSHGTWGNNISVAVKAGSSAGKFTLDVFYGADTTPVESHVDLTLDNAEDILTTSQYISILVTGAVVPAVRAKTPLANGDDGLRNGDGSSSIVDADYLGFASNKSGLYALDNMPINLVSISGITSPAVWKGLISYCEGRRDCFAILDTPKGQTVTGVRTRIVDTDKLASERASIYYSWLVVSDPIGVGKNPTKTIPPSGHVMGVFARTDASQGVWKAPAGEEAKILGIIDIEYSVSDAEQDLLNPVGINCIRNLTGSGTVIWGARTLSNGEFKYNSVQRTITMIGQTVITDLRWTVFKNNDDKLWDMIKLAVGEFLGGIWAQGGLYNHWTLSDECTKVKKHL